MSIYHVAVLSEHLPLQAKAIYYFDNVDDVTAFMWGRSSGKHLIYKDGTLMNLAHLYSDLSELKEYLNKSENL
jgi:hypothetical protein